MDTLHINPWLAPNKSFWDRHPFLKWFGIRFLPGLVVIPAAGVTILTFLGVRIAVSTRLIVAVIGAVIGVIAVAYLTALNIALLLDQHRRINASRDEIELLTIGMALLKKQLTPSRRKVFDALMAEFRYAQSEPDRIREMVFYLLWEKHYSHDANTDENDDGKS